MVSSWRQQQWQQVLTQALYKQREEQETQQMNNVVGENFVSDNLHLKSKSKDNCNFVRAYELEEQTKLLQQKVRKMNSLLPEASTSIPSYDYYYSNESYRSSERGSDNLLVTFDYGYSDSLLEEVMPADDFSLEKKQTRLALADLRTVYPIREELELDDINVWHQKPKMSDVLAKYEDDDYSDSWEQVEDELENEIEVNSSKAQDMQIWCNTALTRAQQQVPNELGSVVAFQVHHVQHADVPIDAAADEYEYEDESLNSVVVHDPSRESSPSAGSANSFYYRQLALGDWGQETVVDEDDDAVDADDDDAVDDDIDGNDDDTSAAYDDDNVAQFAMSTNECVVQAVRFADSLEFYDSLN